MKAKLVYGCPCSGKSTYVRGHAGENDLVYDYDAILMASTTRVSHLTARHAGHFVVLGLREDMLELARNEPAVECVWLQCRWPTDKVRGLLEGLDTEEIFIRATKEECYERLEKDASRPDKEEWKAVIDAWFAEHGIEEGKENDMEQNHRFWNFIRNAAGERILRLEGPIDEESFWGDEVTPRAFREDLEAEEGDVTVWINSPGGNVFAAAEIYTMLCDHKGRITVKIDAIAASAASVIAMAGDRVLMSPVAMLMIHDPMTIAMGNARDMEKAIGTLNEVKESIINAYQKKTGLSHNKISQLMENETWMNAKRAVDLGFADEILFADVVEGEDDEKEVEDSWKPFSTRVMGQTILNRLLPACEDTADTDEESDEAAGEPENLEPAAEGVDAKPPDVGRAAAQEAPPETEPAVDGEYGEEADAEPLKAQTAEPPVIGLDGKTSDGAMPYEILRDRLEWMR